MAQSGRRFRIREWTQTCAERTTVKPELRVYILEECLINPPPQPNFALAIPLVGLFVPKLVELALGGVATLLKKAGEDQTVRAVGHAFTHFYEANEDQALQVNKRIRCMLAIWGVFSDVDKEKWDPNDAALWKLAKAGLVPEHADIGIVFEAAIRPAADQTAFFLDTRHLSVREFIGESGKSERALVVTLSVSTPGNTADGETIALGNIDFGRVKRGDNLVPSDRAEDGYPAFRSNLMPWKQITAASKSAYDADVAAGRAKGKQYMPVTFNLTISETADGNKLLLKLGELLDGAKKEAAAEISKLVIPEERAKVEAERAEAAEKLYAEELAAEVEVRKAKKAYDAGKAEDKPVLAAELEAARRILARKVALRAAAGLPARAAIPEN
jgi:hypothetical protein